jgi:hypothetical protein
MRSSRHTYASTFDSIPIARPPAMEDHVALVLPPELYSPDQIGLVMIELRDQADMLRRQAARQRLGSAGAALRPAALPERLTALLVVCGITRVTLASLEQLIKQLEIVRAKAPVVHVTLADLPGQHLRTELVKWFRREIDPTVLVSFNVNTTIVGGIVVRTGSHLHDYSFRRGLWEHRRALMEVFKRV